MLIKLLKSDGSEVGEITSLGNGMSVNEHILKAICYAASPHQAVEIVVSHAELTELLFPEPHAPRPKPAKKEPAKQNQKKMTYSEEDIPF